MNFLKRVTMIVYMLLLLSVGAVLVLLSLNILVAAKLIETVNVIVQNPAYQITGTVIGVIIMLIGVIAPYRLEKRIKRNRFISFQNPDGEVTISLSAVEDYIHKIAKSIPGIKDVRSHVSSGKKGINVITDVSISASTNIPEVTERIQMEVKNKVQSMLGIEESINIRMNIKKIAKGSKVDELPKVVEKPNPADQVPYR